MVEIERPTTIDGLPPMHTHTIDEWRVMYGEAMHYGKEVRKACFQETMNFAVELQSRDLMMREIQQENTRLKAEIVRLNGASAMSYGDNVYRPSMDGLNASNPHFTENVGFARYASSSGPSYPSAEFGFGQFSSSSGLNTQSSWPTLDEL
ncbi:hypothetical protein LguiA_018216 [Lonicera macranthoides]